MSEAISTAMWRVRLVMDEIGLVGERGHVDEVLELGQAHIGILGIAVGREQRGAPAQLPGGAPLPHHFRNRPIGHAAPALAGRVDLAQAAGVAFAQDVDQHVELLPHQPIYPRHLLQLRLAGLGEDDVLQAIEAHHHIGMAAGPQHRAIHLADERRGGRP